MSAAQAASTAKRLGDAAVTAHIFCAAHGSIGVDAVPIVIEVARPADYI